MIGVFFVRNSEVKQVIGIAVSHVGKRGDSSVAEDVYCAVLPAQHGGAQMNRFHQSAGAI
jgi:hypothetical protein